MYHEVIGMSIVRNMSGVLVGILPFLGGCAQLDEALSDAEMEVPLAEQDGGETAKPNGLDPDVMEACAAPILRSMTMPLVVSEGSVDVANPSLDSSLSGACLEPFQYAVRCALADGATVPGYNVMGEGILTTTSGWRKVGGLSELQKADVLSCLTAFNNTNEQIPICLQGEHISGEQGNCDGYDIFEAVFLTVRTSPGARYAAYIWPLFPGYYCDPGELEAILAQRVCGQPTLAATPPCNAQVRSDYYTACTESQGEITCWGVPAIRTKLTAAGFEEMYPTCEVSAQ